MNFVQDFYTIAEGRDESQDAPVKCSLCIECFIFKCSCVQIQSGDFFYFLLDLRQKEGILKQQSTDTGLLSLRKKRDVPVRDATSLS